MTGPPWNDYVILGLSAAVVAFGVGLVVGACQVRRSS